MPSSEFDALALLIVLVLAVALVNTWLLTRPPRQSKPSVLDGIPMPAEPFPPSPPPSEPQAVLDARYAQARRREQRETRPLAESEWYGGSGGDGYWPQAR